MAGNRSRPVGGGLVEASVADPVEKGPRLGVAGQISAPAWGEMFQDSGSQDTVSVVLREARKKISNQEVVKQFRIRWQLREKPGARWGP